MSRKHLDSISPTKNESKAVAEINMSDRSTNNIDICQVYKSNKADETDSKERCVSKKCVTEALVHDDDSDKDDSQILLRSSQQEFSNNNTNNNNNNITAKCQSLICNRSYKLFLNPVLRQSDAIVASYNPVYNIREIRATKRLIDLEPNAYKSSCITNNNINNNSLAISQNSDNNNEKTKQGTANFVYI